MDLGGGASRRRDRRRGRWARATRGCDRGGRCLRRKSLRGQPGRQYAACSRSHRRSHDGARRRGGVADDGGAAHHDHVGCAVAVRRQSLRGRPRRRRRWRRDDLPRGAERDGHTVHDGAGAGPRRHLRHGVLDERSVRQQAVCHGRHRRYRRRLGRVRRGGRGHGLLGARGRGGHRVRYKCRRAV